MKKILAYIFATLLTLMLGMPLILGIIYAPFEGLMVGIFMIIFWGGIWGFAYLLGPCTKSMTYDQECGLTPKAKDLTLEDRDRRTVKLIN